MQTRQTIQALEQACLPQKQESPSPKVKKKVVKRKRNKKAQAKQKKKAKKASKAEEAEAAARRLEKKKEFRFKVSAKLEDGKVPEIEDIFTEMSLDFNSDRERSRDPLLRALKRMFELLVQSSGLSKKEPELE